MQIVKVKGWGKADVTSATIVAYLEQARASDITTREYARFFGGHPQLSFSES